MLTCKERKDVKTPHSAEGSAETHRQEAQRESPRQKLWRPLVPLPGQGLRPFRNKRGMNLREREQSLLVEASTDRPDYE